MRRLLARPSLLLLAAVCLSLASCSSNNKGKIVGKWKAVAAPNAKADTEVFLEFTADGRATMTKVEGGQTETLFNATYSLGMGDWVTMSGITPAPQGKSKSRDKIKIDGDNLTIPADKGATVTFTRVKG